MVQSTKFSCFIHHLGGNVTTAYFIRCHINYINAIINVERFRCYSGDMLIGGFICFCARSSCVRYHVVRHRFITVFLKLKIIL